MRWPISTIVYMFTCRLARQRTRKGGNKRKFDSLACAKHFPAIRSQPVRDGGSIIAHPMEPCQHDTSRATKTPTKCRGKRIYRGDLALPQMCTNSFYSNHLEHERTTRSVLRNPLLTLATLIVGAIIAALLVQEFLVRDPNGASIFGAVELTLRI